MKKIRYKGKVLGTDEWVKGSLLGHALQRDLTKMGTPEEFFFYILDEKYDIIQHINTLFYMAHPEDEEKGYGSWEDSVVKVYSDSVERIDD
jgi:hypothetical protein